MTWNDFLYFAIPAIICWLLAGILVLKDSSRKPAEILSLVGTVIFTAFIIGLWIGQDRPPLRTMGETRLWYCFFITLIGYFSYRSWKYSWLLSFSSLMGIVFACVNIFQPEIHSKNLMPALQSYWFIPHVTVYILSYAMFGASLIASIILLAKPKEREANSKTQELLDVLIRQGFAFLLLGMLMGAIWAKEAWGHYWSWDPKETWAFITSAAYTLYIHLRIKNHYPRFTLWVVPLAFVLLMITWVGVNYLPSAQSSVHVYGQ